MLVLVAEDEVLIAATLADDLERDGHEVLGPVGSAAEARRLASRRRPDVALVDIALADGEMAGVELVRELGRRWGVRCFFCTAQPAEARRHAALVEGWIDKPYTSADVRRALEQVARRSAPASPFPAARAAGAAKRVLRREGSSQAGIGGKAHMHGGAALETLTPHFAAELLGEGADDARPRGRRLDEVEVGGQADPVV